MGLKYSICISNSYRISTNTTTGQSVDLPAGCNLSIPPGAAGEDSAIISVVLNPHGYAGTLMIGDNEQLVSDIIEMGPAGKTFAKPVKLKIPHSLPKFNKEREYVVMNSDDQGTTWSIMKTLSEADQGDRHVTVEVTHLSTYAVVARPLEHCHRVKEGEASTLKSSEQTGIEVSLPADSAPDGKEISIRVIPVDSAALNCAELKDADRMSGMDSMSHIVRVVKGSNLLLNRPATICLPLSPGKEDSQVRVLSCNKKGNWEDVTDIVDDVVLRESKVAFKTLRLSSGYTVICCDDSSDASGMVNLVANSVRARHVRTVIFKKWMEPRELGIMKARMEAVLEESVDDRITCAKVDKYELQEGTPTPSVSMLENETFCALFNGNLLPDVNMVNNQYGQNFKFYCDRTNRLEFDLKLVGKSRDVRSRVHIFPGPREQYQPCERGETSATPLATAEITAPTGNICDYWLACRRFKKTLEIEDSYFNPDEDRCFCEKCHKDREEHDTYLRGRPKKRYALPVGWCRFGLSLQPIFQDEELNVFGSWHRAYHGTKQDVVKLILKNSSMLLMPGDVAMGGHQLGERPGHFNADKKPDDFDTVQVFVSPSIVYAGLDQYATPKGFIDGHDGKAYKARVAFQLCIRPDSYRIGPETVGARGGVKPSTHTSATTSWNGPLWKEEDMHSTDYLSS
ncbi:ankyrin-3-like [Branchiostoma floridae x Branchiostoma belcheri]